MTRPEEAEMEKHQLIPLGMKEEVRYRRRQGNSSEGEDRLIKVNRVIIRRGGVG